MPLNASNVKVQEAMSILYMIRKEKRNAETSQHKIESLEDEFEAFSPDVKEVAAQLSELVHSAA